MNKNFLHQLYQPLVKFFSQFNSPKAEAFKEILRLGLIMVVSWVITEILAQMVLVPEVYTLKIWVFSFIIPLRASLFWVLTVVQKWIDKFMWEKDNEGVKTGGEHSTGLVPV